MKIIIASDSFKGSCSSLEAAEYIEKGLLKVFPEANISKLSVADGGEGTVDTILQSMPGQLINQDVTGPDGKIISASYGLLQNGTAIIEMASASGLPLVNIKDRNPLTATTRGTGELILSALNKGCTRIILGLGGSATTDGGMGMARALGYKFFDLHGKELNEGGGELQNLKKIDTTNIDSRLKSVEFIAACDVTNPLYGENGAAYVYGPQKGADTTQVEVLDKGLRTLDSIVKQDFNIHNSDYPGSGAAGGLGFGVLTFLKGELSSGITTVLNAINFDSYLNEADLIITGEGRIDGQSVNGKVPVGIASKASKLNIPVLVIAGGIGDKIEEVYKFGIDSVMTIVNCPMELADAMDNAKTLLEDSAERAMRMIKIGLKIKK